MLVQVGPGLISDLRLSQVVLGGAEQLLAQRFRRRQRDQRDAYDDQGRNIAEQMRVLGGVRQCLHRHDARVNQARPGSKGDQAAILRGARDAIRRKMPRIA